MRAGLNPLHCGAVVASRDIELPLAMVRGLNPLHCGAVVASLAWGSRVSPNKKSQSPSLRGSGRFEERARQEAATRARLNPLHCGAVVASFRVAGFYQGMILCLNPLHCGAVVASQHKVCVGRLSLRVSIPFIAGQWSLPEGSAGAPPTR